ncbi:MULTISPECIES: nucleoside deaminase [unclassified Halanaerobium]|uniref:nucleoside deaminase n=1 Tax=unclassified Halanaerobium TaxID=2641197 RepID=UPI000DF16768|nr:MULTISPECIES: nucleoside deaminase [unclassified Halanaerobium]RCW50730.1 tRNA(Arg) A34 adenosine deaminase TadA [Halanaerobium sp. MA284_MarDTE_T2]RCW78569.1 tRNA(Arg) A34 adenosine deaminase TadA [Halanaerobium sp. DL-01]
MSWKDHTYYLKESIKEAEAAVKHNNMPFGAILVDQAGNIILRQENIEITESDCTGHAETQLMVQASKKYDKKILKECTLYTTVEPCAMCSGAIYWGNVGRVVFGLSEKKLLKITGNDEQNPTLDLPCRKVFQSGQKDIEVIGPIPELKTELSRFYKDFFGN